MLLRLSRLNAARIRLARPTVPTLPSARLYSKNTEASPVKLRGAFVTPQSTPEKPATPPDAPNVSEVTTIKTRSAPRDYSWKIASPHTTARQGQPSDPRGRGGGDERRPNGRSSPSRSPHRREEGPYYFAQKIKKWIERNEVPGKPLTGPQVDEVIRMITTTRPANVNAAVWNLVLALLGRQEQYGNMWKTYNQMKKRGFVPSSRTYTVMLNAYAGVAHGGIAQKAFSPASPPSPLTMRRVTAIYEHSQRHIRQYLKYAKGETDDGGLEAADAEDDREGFINEAQVNIMPTNAYLKFLSRFGLWSEMQAVFLAMDPHGPLSPDQVTYATMLNTVNNIDHYRRASAGREGAASLPEIEVGPQARVLWDQAVRNLHPPAEGRKLDEGVALAALQCFVAGRPEDKRLAESLIPRLWGLSSPTAPTVASLSAPQQTEKDASLPRFRLDVRSATQLMSLLGRLGRTSIAAHYTSQILERNIKFDLPALRVAVHNLAAVHDVEAAMAVLDQYSERWPVDVLNAILSAARWSKDWDAALTIFRRMTHLPQGVEKGDFSGTYEWESPNGRPTDSRGRKWVRHSVEPDLQSIDLLLRAGLESGIPATREALNVYKYYPREKWYTFSAQGKTVDILDDIPNPGVGTRLKIEERIELARTVERAAGTLQFKAKSKEEKEDMQKLLDDVTRITAKWKNLKRSDKTTQPAQQRERDSARGHEKSASERRPDRHGNGRSPHRRQDSNVYQQRRERNNFRERQDGEFSRGREPEEPRDWGRRK